MADKAINFKIDSELYKKIKIRIAQKDATLKAHIIELLERDLEENK